MRPMWRHVDNDELPDSDGGGRCHRCGGAFDIVSDTGIGFQASRLTRASDSAVSIFHVVAVAVVGGGGCGFPGKSLHSFDLLLLL